MDVWGMQEFMVMGRPPDWLERPPPSPDWLQRHPTGWKGPPTDWKDLRLAGKAPLPRLAAKTSDWLERSHN